MNRCDHCVRPYCEQVADCILRWRDAEEPPVFRAQRWPVLLMPHTRARAGQVATWTSGELAGRLARCQVVSEKSATPGWLPVSMRDGQTRRLAKHVKSVWGLVCDLDEGVGSIADLWGRIGDLGLEAYAHTTYSHTEAKPKARVVFPFVEPVKAEQWREVWGAGSRWAASWGAAVDKACKDPSRLYYLPSAPQERRKLFRSGRWSGARLPWRRMLCDYPEPKPREYIPIPEPTNAGLSAMRRESDDRKKRWHAEATLKGILSDLQSCPKGQRNPAIYRAGCRLGRLVRAGHLPLGEVERALVDFVRGMPGADRRDITTVTRALRVGLEDATT